MSVHRRWRAWGPQVAPGLLRTLWWGPTQPPEPEAPQASTQAPAPAPTRQFTLGRVSYPMLSAHDLQDGVVVIRMPRHSVAGWGQIGTPMLDMHDGRPVYPARVLGTFDERAAGVGYLILRRQARSD